MRIPLQCMLPGLMLLLATVLTQRLASQAYAIELPTTDGFYGIWYSVGATGNQYAYKYSGGLGTYTHQTSPIAVYSEDINRTYFLYGGTNGTNNVLRNYISYFDHTSNMLARPRELRLVGGNDNHKNATMTIDDDGYLHVFGNSHGNSGTGNYYKSAQPYSITDFNEIPLPGSVFNNNAGEVKLAYSNAFYVSGNGLMLVYNEYDDGRAAHVATSTDGLTWTEKELLDTEQGHYTLARQNGNTIGVSADYHRNGSLDHRTNLYYLQTSNFGQTWTNAAGTPLSLPLTTRNNTALVYDYFAENKMVYMKDIDYDAAGNPILLYLTVSDADNQGFEPGPKPGGRTIHTARWTGSTWDIRNVMMTDHNYDHGELTVEANGTWRITAPFIDGPQKYGTGGEVGVWTSPDQGATWQLLDQLTENSQYNHTYVRHAVDAHDGFFDYWADGNAFALSASRLYFSTKSGDVYRMPTHFTDDFAAPELVTNEPPPTPPSPTHILLSYEGFDYANTGSAQLAEKNGGDGWGGVAWTSAGQSAGFTVSQDDASLSSAAFPFTAMGDRGKAAGAGSSNRISRPLPSPFDLGSDDELYVSFLMRKDGSSTSTSSNNMEFSLTQGTEGNGVIRFGSNSSNGFFVWESSSVGATFENTVLGQTYFVVLKLEARAESPDAISAMIFSPTETVPTAEPTNWDGDYFLSSDEILDNLRLWIGANAIGQFDEIRLGTSWAAVIGRLVGDHNGDGAVDLADYIVWRKTDSGNQQGYLDWQSHYGESLSSAIATANGSSDSVAVPEPATWPMLLVAWGFATKWRFANKF